MITTLDSKPRATQASRVPEGIVVPDERPEIQVRRLNFFYGRTQVLFEINMDIPTNQVTALIGPSGCGKSTFLRLLNRMNDIIPETRMEGSVQIGTTEIYEPGVDVVELRKRVGMVFQKPNPFPKSIFENIAFGPRIHGNNNRAELASIVEDSLIRAGLWGEVKDRLHESALSLSGGQQQRLCIARVLAVNPEVVLMDEPCSALDPISTGRIEELMVDLKANYTIVIVTHNMQQAARVSEDTGFFLNGELVEFDKSTTIFTSPRDKRTEDYITGRFG